MFESLHRVLFCSFFPHKQPPCLLFLMSSQPPLLIFHSMIYLSLLRVMQLDQQSTAERRFCGFNTDLCKVAKCERASFWMFYTCWGLMFLKTMLSTSCTHRGNQGNCCCMKKSSAKA